MSVVDEGDRLDVRHLGQEPVVHSPSVLRDTSGCRVTRWSVTLLLTGGLPVAMVVTSYP